MLNAPLTPPLQKHGRTESPLFHDVTRIKFPKLYKNDNRKKTNKHKKKKNSIKKNSDNGDNNNDDEEGRGNCSGEEDDDEWCGDVVYGVELCVVRCHRVMVWMESILSQCGGGALITTPTDVVMPLLRVMQVRVVTW